MLSKSNTSNCSICCENEAGYICKGCSENFCWNCLWQHRNSISSKFVEFECECKQFQEKIIKEKDNLDAYLLMRQINEWELNSKKKIEDKAKECQQIAMQHVKDNTSDIEEKLKELIDRIGRENEDFKFNETKLKQSKTELNKLTTRLAQLSNISFEENSNQLINNITINIPRTLPNNNPFSIISTESRRPIAKAKRTSKTISSNDSRLPIFTNQLNFNFSSINEQLTISNNSTEAKDENVLFCERAKLYRFDTSSNEMKAVGIGDIQILQHKTNDSYRVSMRCEKTLAVVANHPITSQMELKRHQNTENAYVWSATDFSNGDAKFQTLCIHFKYSSSSQCFAKYFEQGKQACIKNGNS